MNLKKKCVFLIVISTLISNIFVSFIAINISSKRSDLQCNEIIKSRVSNDLIALDKNRSDILKYFDAFEIANTVKKIGEQNELGNYAFLCKFWSNSFEHIIFSILDKKPIDNNGSIHLSKDYRQGVELLNTHCKAN